MFFSIQRFWKLLNKRFLISVLVVIVLFMILYKVSTHDRFIPTSCLNDLKAITKKQSNKRLKSKSLATFISEQDQVIIEKQIKKDKKMIAKLCNSLTPIAPIFRHLTIKHYNMDENMNVGWCFNAKSGSSTLKFEMLNASERINDICKADLKNAYDIYSVHRTHNEAFLLPDWIEDSTNPTERLNMGLELDSMFSFSFVRHPYVRLVSTYEDKALGHNKNGGVFPIFKDKTFPQFIDYILSDITSPEAEHWRPQYLNCNYCEINYDFIGRTENLSRDLGYIATKKNLSTLKSKQRNFRLNHSGATTLTLNKSKNNVNERKLTTEEKTVKYFSTLNSSQLEKLYLIFKTDFKMFGYSIYPYVSDSAFQNAKTVLDEYSKEIMQRYY